ncbi:MAG: hypothetical protein HY403_08605 [Elusimicrobia bacterium]|nr:hypothetical protein [Elusimicrobiota bacterium]
MIERLVVSAGLAAVLLVLLDRPRPSPSPLPVRLLLTGLLSWAALGWTANVRRFPDAFPLELPAGSALALQSGVVILGAAAFAAARGRGGLAAGAVFGLSASAIGWCASRWPHLARAVELCGGVFTGMLLTTLLAPAFAATCAALAAALLREERRPSSRRVILALVAVWALATVGAEAALSRVWGFGPRTLAAAAGVPTNAASRTLAVAWLYPEGGRSHRVEERRMSSETTDLSPESIDRLEAFLGRTRFRGVFAQEALAAVRLGRLQWWNEEAALDALTLSLPGRVHPDYLRALELLRAGPVTPARYDRLERLAAATGRRVEGFERASDAQRIFEGFSAAYARFADEEKAREWLSRLEGLWAVSDKRVEAGPLEDLRDGRVEGSIFVDAGGAAAPRVGLFMVWRSSVTGGTRYWLSSSRVPDRDGGFSFEGLGPGRYVLALLGEPEELRGAFAGLPGFIEVTDERPVVRLDPIRIRTRREPAFGARAVPREARLPMALEPPLRLGR